MRNQERQSIESYQSVSSSSRRITKRFETNYNAGDSVYELIAIASYSAGHYTSELLLTERLRNAFSPFVRLQTGLYYFDPIVHGEDDLYYGMHNSDTTLTCLTKVCFAVAYCERRRVMHDDDLLSDLFQSLQPKNRWHPAILIYVRQ